MFHVCLVRSHHWSVLHVRQTSHSTSTCLTTVVWALVTQVTSRMDLTNNAKRVLPTVSHVTLQSMHAALAYQEPTCRQAPADKLVPLTTTLVMLPPGLVIGAIARARRVRTQLTSARPANLTITSTRWTVPVSWANVHLVSPQKTHRWYVQLVAISVVLVTQQTQRYVLLATRICI